MMNTQMMPQLRNQRYRLGQELGHGAMGLVYSAYDRIEQLDLAIKFVQRNAEPVEIDSKQDLNSLRLAFINEYQILSTIRHPNIISVYDFGFDKNFSPYIVMELLDSHQTICEAAKNSLDAAVALFSQVLQTLAYLHQGRGIIHGDLKPGNILVLTGQVKVLDFGLSANHKAHNSQFIEGTTAYMAPELVTGQAISHQSDLFALGVLLYETLFERLPFKTITETIQCDPDLSPLRAFPESKQGLLTRLFRKLLAKDLRERYANAEAALNDLSLLSNTDVKLLEVRENFLQAPRFIGRETELDLLLAAVSQAATTQGSAWLISGESGVGKSRFLNEIRTFALIEGMPVLAGQVLEHLTTPFALWSGILRQLVLMTDISDTEAAVLKIICPDIETLLNRKLPEISTLSIRDNQTRLLDTIVNIFLRLHQPILLLIEDLHRFQETDNPDFILLKRIFEMADSSRLLIVCSARRDEAPALEQDFPSAKLIHLERLSEANSTALTEAMLGDLANLQELQTLLQKEAGGNPLFLIEIIRSLLQEARELKHIQDLNLTMVQFPEGIYKIMQRRLNALSNIYPFLEFVAILGKQVDMPALSASKYAEQLDTLLLQCLNASVMRIQDRQWIFDHDRIHDLILDNIAPQTRMDLHRQAATALEQAYPQAASGPSQHAAKLAYHWQALNEPSKAQHYTISAGIYAVEHFAYKDAVRFLADSLNSSFTSRTQEIQVKRKLALAYDGLSQYETARQYYEEVLKLAREENDLENTAEALNGLGVIAWRLGETDMASGLLTQALEIFRQVGNAKGEGRCLGNIGHCHFELGNYETSASYHEQALNISRSLKDEGEVGIDLGNLGNAYIKMGQAEKAVEIYQQSLSIKERVGDLRGLALTYSNIGAAYSELNQAEKSMDYLRRSIEISRQIGNLQNEAIALANLGAQYNQNQEIRLAEEAYARAAALFAKLKLSQYQAYIKGMWAHLIVGLGRLEQAISGFDEALQTNADPNFEVYVLNQTGYTLAELGQLDKAFEKHQSALKIASSKQMQNDEGYSLGGLANVLIFKKDYQGAIQYLLQALDIAREIKGASLLEELKLRLARAYLHNGSHEDALAILDTKEDEAWAGTIESASFTSLRALVLVCLGKYEEAKAAFLTTESLADETIAKMPDLFDPKYLKALALAGQMLLASEKLQKNLLQLRAMTSLNEACNICDAVGVRQANKALLHELQPLDQDRQLDKLISILAD